MKIALWKALHKMFQRVQVTTRVCVQNKKKNVVQIKLSCVFCALDKNLEVAFFAPVFLSLHYKSRYMDSKLYAGLYFGFFLDHNDILLFVSMCLAMWKDGVCSECRNHTPNQEIQCILQTLTFISGLVSNCCNSTFWIQMCVF